MMDEHVTPREDGAPSPSQPKDFADDSSYITETTGTVDVDLSHSMDLSSNQESRSEEKPSSALDMTTSETVIKPKTSNHHAKNDNDNGDCDTDKYENVRKHNSLSDSLTSTQGDLAGQSNQLDYVDDLEQDTGYGGRTPTSQCENTNQNDEEPVNHLRANATKRRQDTDESQHARALTLPGAFKVYSKLATVRQEKDERCLDFDTQPDEDTATPPQTKQQFSQNPNTTAEKGVATCKKQVKSEEKELRDPRRESAHGFRKPSSGDCEASEVSKRQSEMNLQKPSPMCDPDTKSHSATTTVSTRSCLKQPRDHNERPTNEEGGSQSSQLAPFLEDLSESIDELTQSPGRCNSRSAGGSPRESIMHRRVMQKRRRSTAATEPGAIGSSSNNENLHDYEQPAGADDLLVLSPPPNCNESEDGGSNSSWVEMDSFGSEQALKWPNAITAELVAETALKDEERAKVVEETTIALTSNATPAEVIDLEAMIQQKVFQDDTKHARRRRIYLLSCMVFAVAIFALVASLLLAFNPTDTLANSTPSKAPTTSPAPTLFTEGSPAFQSRDELLNAVDDYVRAEYRGTAKNSSVAERYGYPIGSWNVSRLTDFSRLFDIKRHDDEKEALLEFDEDIGEWDVSNAVTMSYMFAGLKMFEGKGLSRWNVEKVTDFSFMFAGAARLRADLRTWNTSSAKTMASMFSFGSYNSGIAEWDMSSVETTASMFRFAVSPGNNTIDLNNWDVSNVNDMSQMFLGSAFNGKIDQWDVGNVETMSYMFSQSSFNQDISSWRTNSLKEIRGIFGVSAYREDLTNWDTSKVNDFSFAFYNSTFDGDVSSWNTTNGRRFVGTFSFTEYFDGDLSSWDMKNAEDCRGMFSNSKSYTGKGISGWNVSKLQNTNEMFGWASNFQEDISPWKMHALEDGSLMFVSATSFNHSLCAWSEGFPADAIVRDMFLNSGCAVTAAPDLEANGTSFCSQCDRR